RRRHTSWPRDWRSDVCSSDLVYDNDASMKTIITNGRVVTAVDDYNADILIEDGKVAMIGKKIDVKADKTIDAKGRLVIPGGIDQIGRASCRERVERSGEVEG